MYTNQSVRSKIEKVLNKLGINKPLLLGEGGEGPVFDYGDYALKIYLHTTDRDYFVNLQEFQKKLQKYQFTFVSPQIYEIGEVDETIYTIEKKLQGMPMDKRIISLHSADRKKLYSRYYDAIRQLGKVAFPELDYGNIIRTVGSINANSWQDYLLKVFEQQLSKTRERMVKLVSNFEIKTDYMKQLIASRLGSNQKQLVHSDYYLNNVLTGDDLSITAVLDFSKHCVVGDSRMDIASVLMWNEIDSHVHPEDYSFLFTEAKKDYDEDIIEIAEVYLLFSSFYFADMEDPSFSVKHLNNQKLWDKHIM